MARGTTMTIRSQTLVLCGLTLLLATCNRHGSATGECKGGEDCPGGQLCLSGKCVDLCNSDKECGAGRRCDNGACVQGAPSGTLPPLVLAVNGTGTLDGQPGHTSRHLGDRVVILGEHLLDAEVKLTGIEPARDTMVLAECGSGTDTELEVALPTDIMAGSYRLQVANQAGVCDTTLSLLQGEPGFGDLNYAGSDSQGGAALDVACADCIDGTKVLDGSITGADIAPASIAGSQIIGGAITEAQRDVITDNQALLFGSMLFELSSLGYVMLSMPVQRVENGVIHAFTRPDGIDGAQSSNYRFTGNALEPDRSFGSDVLVGGTATASSSVASQPAALAVDNSDSTYWRANTLNSAWWKYDLGAGGDKTVTLVRINAYGDVPGDLYSVRNFSVSASNDDLAWTSVLWGTHNASGWKSFELYNTTAFRYYRVSFIGNDLNPQVYELEMSETAYYNNLTLVSVATPALTQPARARLTLLVEASVAVVAETDLRAWVSRDDGTSWAQVTLIDRGSWGTNRNAYSSAMTPLSGSGTAMRYKVVTDNHKLIRLREVQMLYE
jgi:hypothetical protein